MQVLKPIVGIISISSILFLFMYPLVLLSCGAALKKLDRRLASILAGLLTGMVALVTMSLADYFYDAAYMDGKFVVVLMAAILFGPGAAAVAALVVILAGFGLGGYPMLVLILQTASVLVIAIFSYRLRIDKGLQRVSASLVYLYIVTIIQALLWELVVVGKSLVGAGTVGYQLLSILIMLIVNFGIMKMFIAEILRSEHEAVMDQLRKDLQLQNDELNSTYQQLAASEEGLQTQYDELNLAYEKLSESETKLMEQFEEISDAYEELYQNKKDIEKKEEQYRLMFKSGNEALWDYEPASRQFNFSENLQELFETYFLDENDLFDIPQKYVHPEDKALVEEMLHRINVRQQDGYLIQHRIVLPDAQEKWVVSKVVVLRNDEGEITRIAGSFRDITEEMVKENELRRLVYHDQLTGLPNRRQLQEEFDKRFSSGEKAGHKYNFMYLDLDNFKNINDTMGHTVGDMLLKQLSTRLEDLKTEREYIYRFGGDEFVIIVDVSDMGEESAIYTRDLAERLMKAVGHSFLIKGAEYAVTSSIGIAAYPDDGTTLEDILKNADNATFKAKHLGRNKYVIFDRSMYSDYLEKLNLENLLRRAIGKDEIKALYQPQFDKNNKIVGFEALARWTSSVAGVITPDRFIPIAEEIGMISTIRNVILESACKFARSINEISSYDIVVSVNVSAIEILQADFLESILSVINRMEVKPSQLGVEITESALMESFDITCEKIEYLKRQGLKISLDDFGTGYSSLNYLSRIPVSTVKIDKSFVDKILTDEKHRTLTSTIIWLSKYLNLETVAEGVETVEQLDALLEMQCDFIQGYLLGRPMTQEQAIELVQNPESLL